MKVLSENPGDEEVLAAVREWMNLLVAEDFEAASDYLHPDAAAWNLRECIANYEAGAPLRGGPSRVTPPETAGGPLDPLEEVFRADDGRITSVDYAFPINGEWSELVAFFETIKVPGGIVLRLMDIRIP